MPRVWKVGAWPVFSPLVCWAVSSHQLIRTQQAQPLDPHLISPGCWPSAPAWPSPLRGPFISNTKWSCVVKWSLIFLIADSRDACWFSVSVLYFASLICSWLNLIELTWAKGRGCGYAESPGLEVVLMISWCVCVWRKPQVPSTLCRCQSRWLTCT